MKQSTLNMQMCDLRKCNQIAPDRHNQWQNFNISAWMWVQTGINFAAISK